jgi:hypothetical protein
MKRVRLMPMAVLVLCLAGTGHADRALPHSGILELLARLTEEPRQTWIAAGTIEARHQEYRAPQTTDAATIQSEIQQAVEQYQSDPYKREQTEETRRLKLAALPFNVRYKLANEHTMSSRVVVRYDGERFYWEINLDARKDSVQPEASLAGNPMLDRFDVNGNGRRIFVWDGQTYTTYAASGGRAFVDAAGTLPHAVTGPLTAGLIPWGHGRFAYAALAAAEVTATERERDGAAGIDMSITHADGAATRLVLDPTLDYAVTSAARTGRGTVVYYTCCDYRRVGCKRVPFTISMERRDAGTNTLLGSEQWSFEDVTAATPAGDAFEVPYAADAVLEYGLPLAGRHPTCDYAPTADIDALLVQHLACAAAGDRYRNCATVALQYAVAQLGKSTRGRTLTPLLAGSDQTSLQDMKRLAEELGLHCRAIKTDLTTLQELTRAIAILHFPGRNHFVVLDEVNSRYVWLIDLASDRFYYRQSLDTFPAEWSQGTALLLSDRPISGPFTDLDEAACERIRGSAGWTCTELLQEQGVVGCDTIGGNCLGEYTYYWERYGCEAAVSGTCVDQLAVRYQESLCAEEPLNECAATGEWIYYYMLACQ